VVKTTVYLPDADMQALEAAARRRHQSKAELIREGVRRVLAEEAGPVLPDFGILNAEPVTAAEVDAALAAGLGACSAGVINPDAEGYRYHAPRRPAAAG
jgi:hypothetical protein